MKKSDMLQPRKVRRKGKNEGLKNPGDFLTDEEEGYTKEERDRISEELSSLYSKQKSVSVMDILLDIQHRLSKMELLLQAKNVSRKAS